MCRSYSVISGAVLFQLSESPNSFLNAYGKTVTHWRKLTFNYLGINFNYVDILENTLKLFLNDGGS